jgi:hypothetical protein
MKAVFYSYLFLLMLCGGLALYAGTQQGHNGCSSTRGPAKKQHLKLNSTDRGDTLLDEADIDADDEYHSDHDEDEGLNKFLTAKHSLTNSWYLTFAMEPISNYYSKRLNTLPPFCGNSSPIYITQRVLRI